MAKVDTIKTSFASGELAPELYGRTDIAQYENACAIVENFLVRPYGSLLSTPGTEFINETKTGGTTGISRLIPFVFSRTDAFAIEMGVGYFRFFTNGAVVVSTGTTPYEVAHTYTEDELYDIHFRQKNDVIWLFHGNHPVRKLTRLAAENWTLSDVTILGGPFLDDNTDLSITLTASQTDGTINVTVSPTNANLFIPSGSTLGHLNTYWKIGETRTDSTTGLEVQGYVKLTNIVNSYTATATVMAILTTSVATTTWAEGAWSDVNGYPSRGTFHQSRLAVARTDQEPNNVWLSKPFLFDEFDVNAGADGDAINIQIVAAESNDIKWLASAKALIAGTFGGDFVIEASDGGALTPETTNVSQESGIGSESIIPKKIGSYFYYIQRFSKKLRELFYTWEEDVYKAVDTTILSPHISGDGGFKEIAYQQNPDSILWCCCSNGTIATLTREVDQEVMGWARQVTDGYFESICTIPSSTEDHDEVWVIVKRTINGNDVRYVERFKSQIVPARQDKCWYVHSGLSYDAYEANTTATISLSATTGTSVILTSSAAYFSADDVGQRIRAIDSSGVTVGEMKITGYTSSTVVVGDIKFDFDASAYAAGLWGLSVDTITGLDHLEASEVVVLADGGLDKPDKTVSNGSISLSYNYFVVTVGLPYTQIIETLPQEKASQRGTAQGKLQKITQVGFKVNNSHKGFYGGGTSDLVEKLIFRDPTTLMGTPELLYTGVLPNALFRDDYRYGSRVRIENRDPLPIEMLSIMTMLDTNDK